MPEVNPKNLIVGFDVGSTTVKSVVVDTTTDQIIWSDYQRHDTKQPEKVMEFLKRMEEEVGIVAGHSRIFITGSGGGGASVTLVRLPSGTNAPPPPLALLALSPVPQLPPLPQPPIRESSFRSLLLYADLFIRYAATLALCSAAAKPSFFMRSATCLTKLAAQPTTPWPWGILYMGDFNSGWDST